MIEDIIIIDLHNYTLETNVFIVKDGQPRQTKVRADLSAIAEVAVGLAHGNDIYKVRLVGAQTLATQIADEIKLAEASQYSDNSITVEIE